MELRRHGADDAVFVFEDSLDSSTEAWRTRTLDLAAFALRDLDLCIATEEMSSAGEPLDEGFALWQQPVIDSARTRAGRVREEDLEQGELTPEELDARKKHLEALGYIDGHDG